MPECPSCGGELDPCTDAYGTAYQCHDMECLQVYTADEVG